MTEKHKDETAPATMGDLKPIKDELHAVKVNLNAVKGDVIAVKNDVISIKNDLHVFKDEIKRHFDVVAERLTEDFKGIFKDRTEQHDDAIADLRKRVAYIEDHLGLIAAS